MKYKVGNKVRIKSLDWYNKNKDADGFVHCGDKVFNNSMSIYCGKIVTIDVVYPYYGYDIREDMGCKTWTDEMIEGQADEIEITQDIKAFSEGYDHGYVDGQHDMNEWVLPEGFEFHDENGNVINATKIILEKKKKEYPKSYEECCKVLGYNQIMPKDHILGYKGSLLSSFQQLLICLDAYLKIAGEEMGLGKPWEPDWNNEKQDKYGFHNEVKYTIINSAIFVFPTAEMRDAFYENFKELIESVKELL